MRVHLRYAATTPQHGSRTRELKMILATFEYYDNPGQEQELEFESEEDAIVWRDATESYVAWVEFSDVLGNEVNI